MSKIRNVVDEYHIFDNILDIKSNNISKIYPVNLNGEVRWVLSSRLNNIDTTSYINTNMYNFLAPFKTIGNDITLNISDDFVIESNGELSLSLEPNKYSVIKYESSVNVKTRYESKRAIDEILNQFISSITPTNNIVINRGETKFLDLIINVNDIFEMQVRYIINLKRGIHNSVSPDNFTLLYKTNAYEIETNNIYKIPINRLPVSNMNEITEDMVANFINNSNRLIYIKDRIQSINIKIVEFEGVYVETNDGLLPTMVIDNIFPIAVDGGFIYPSSNLTELTLTLNGTNVNHIDFSNTFTINKIIINGTDNFECDLSNCDLDLFEGNNSNMKMISFINSKNIKIKSGIYFQNYFDSNIEII